MRAIGAGLLAAAAATQIMAAPGLAVDSASCTGPQEWHANRPFTLTASGSPYGDYTYSWDLDNDGSFEVAPSSDARTTTEKATAGTYTFGVLITDNSSPAGDPKHEARGTCQVTLVNDPPKNSIEMHPLEKNVPSAGEALRFTYYASDNEDDTNQRLISHEFDFDGDGQFEYSDKGNGEVFVSFPAGFDKDVTLRSTDGAGASVEAKLHVKTTRSPWGFGGGSVIAPVSLDAIPKVVASAPKTINRKTLLKKGVVATFTWGSFWGHATVEPLVRFKGTVADYGTYTGDSGYAPGERVAVKPLLPQLKDLIRRGAKQILLRWKVDSHDGPQLHGTLKVRITG